MYFRLPCILLARVNLECGHLSQIDVLSRALKVDRGQLGDWSAVESRLRRSIGGEDGKLALLLNLIDQVFKLFEVVVFVFCRRRLDF